MRHYQLPPRGNHVAIGSSWNGVGTHRGLRLAVTVITLPLETVFAAGLPFVLPLSIRGRRSALVRIIREDVAKHV